MIPYNMALAHTHTHTIDLINHGGLRQGDRPCLPDKKRKAENVMKIYAPAGQKEGHPWPLAPL